MTWHRWVFVLETDRALLREWRWETLDGLAAALRATRTELETAQRLLADSDSTLASTVQGYEENERELEAADATLQQARQLHRQAVTDPGVCNHDGFTWPCQTARLLSSRTDDKDEP